MKKISSTLLAAFIGLFSFSGANAQLTLGTSPYTQNFDNIASGLPTGWGVYVSATATSLGTPAILDTNRTRGLYYDTSCSSSLVINGGFKNYPSATAVTARTSCTTQPTISNRALGVRQVTNTSSLFPGSDSGASFVLHLANTAGKSNFTATFKLQSLDSSSPRTTTWLVQYRRGTTGAFATASATGTLTTGGNSFTNRTISVNFGSNLDTCSSDVYIRLVTLTGSTGAGNRTSTTIDDYSLSWTGCVAPTPGAITGPTAVCIGASIRLDDTTTGGTWTSSNSSIASVNASTGVVTGVSAGTATITYTITNACGSGYVTQLVTVEASAVAGTVTGADSVCMTLTTTLTASATGGVWSSTNTSLATVSTTGVVTGVASGMDTIKYTVTNSCGSVEASHNVYVKNCHLGVTTVAEGAFTISPNPTTGAITISSNDMINSVEIFNQTGVRVYNVTDCGKNTTVSIDWLPNGIYFTKINGTSVYKVIKQ